MNMQMVGRQAYLELREHAFYYGWRVERARQHIEEGGEDYWEVIMNNALGNLREVYAIAAALDCYMDVYNASVRGRNEYRKGDRSEYDIARAHVGDAQHKRQRLNREWGVKGGWAEAPVKKPVKHCTVVSVPL